MQLIICLKVKHQFFNCKKTPSYVTSWRFYVITRQFYVISWIAGIIFRVDYLSRICDCYTSFGGIL